MMFPLTSIRGIAIRVHVSALAAFLGLLLLLASGYFPALLPQERALTYWAVAFLCTLALFLSNLAHELAHSLVAQARGIPVDAVTLFLFGVSSDINQDRERPSDEMLISMSGPLLSLGIAAVAAAARFGLPNPSQPLALFLEAVLLLNVWLGAFNLLPTLPLDGGRVLRGLLWKLAGDYRRATWIASIVGRALAGLLLFSCVALLILSLDQERSPIPAMAGYDPRVMGAAGIFLAWFLNRGAVSAYRQVEMQGKVAGVCVADVMTREPPIVQPWTSIEEVVSDHFLQRGERAVAVARGENLLVGLVAYADIRRIPRTEWATRAAGEVMTPLAKLITVAPTDSVEAAIRHMAQGHLNQLPVVVDGQLVGMVARVNILRFLEVKDSSG
jgi:Zn-dependent protease/CBS domain-containing protein